MTSAEIQKIGEHSASEYYALVSNTAAGKSVATVSKVTQERGNRFSCKVERKLRNLDEAYIRIDDPLVEERFYLSEEVENKYISPEYLVICEYDDIDNVVTLEARRDFVPIIEQLKPSRIEFVSDLSFLVKNVEKWYKYESDRIRIPSVPKIEKEEIFHRSYTSAEQKEATELALSNSCSYIWGAPGTGKTQIVLADCVMSYIDKDMPVFILAPTNNALEQTLRAVITALKEDNREIDCVLRLGAASNKFAQEYGEICERSDIRLKTERLSYTIKLLKERLERQNEAKKARDNHDLFCELEKTLDDCLKKQEEISAEIHEKELRISEINSNISAIYANIKHLNKKYDELRKKEKSFFFKIKAFFKRSLRESIKEEKEGIDDQLTQNNSYLSKVFEEKDSVESDIRKNIDISCSLKETYDEICTELAELSRDTFGKKLKIETMRSRFQKNISEYSDIGYDGRLEEKIDIREKSYNLLVEGIKEDTKNKLVFGFTIDYFYAHHKNMKETGLMPDKLAHIFLDEAAYCSMIKTGILFSFDVPVTFFGDHMQLPPVCAAPDRMVQSLETGLFMWTQSAIFFPEILSEDMTIEKSFEKYMDSVSHSHQTAKVTVEETIKTAFLPRTYRFGNNLAKILDEFVYHNGFCGIEDADTKITVIDVPESEPDRLAKKNSKENLSEAKVISEYIKGIDTGECAVSTPFRAQRTLLAKTVKGLDPDDILTVHTSQGREWATVILSAVDSKPTFMLNSKIPHGLRVINTAVSRTKNEIVIVCDRKRWLPYRDDQFLARLVSSATKTLQFK